MQETLVDSWVGKIPWRMDRLPTPVFLGFPGDSDDKESACRAGDLGSIPGLQRFPGGRYGNPLQYSCLENPHGERSLVDYSPWGPKELDTTEWLSMHTSLSRQCKDFRTFKPYLSLLQLLGLPCSSADQESICNAGDSGSIPGSGRYTGEGIGYPLSILGFPLWLSW